MRDRRLQRGRLRFAADQARLIATFLHVGWPIWIVLQALTLLSAGFKGLRACCSVAGGDPTPLLTDIATATPVISGLAVAAYFITALLPSNDGFRAGMRQLYRTRTILPLLISATLTFLCTILAELAHSKSFTWADYMIALAGFQLVPFLIATAGVFGRIVLYFDYVAVARELARDIRTSDYAEWNLFTITYSTTGTQPTPDVTITIDRLNTALQDPLMPIHELILDAGSKELASYANAMLARVGAEYGVRWKIESSSPHEWRYDEVGRVVAPLGAAVGSIWRATTSRLFVADAAAKRALQLRTQRSGMLMLVLHYLRRLPNNDKINGVPADYRRQYLQFELCRFATLLLKSSSKSSQFLLGVTPDELRQAAILTLYAVMEIEVEFSNQPRAGHLEPLAALPLISELLKSQGYTADSSWLMRCVAWIVRNTDHLRSFLVPVDIEGEDAPGTAPLPPEDNGEIPNPWSRWRAQTGRPRRPNTPPQGGWTRS